MNRCGYQHKCQYTKRYEDGRASSGILHKIHLASIRRLMVTLRVLLSLVVDTKMRTLHLTKKVPGMIGLNRQPQSFITQLSIKKFAYCFPYYNVPYGDGYIKFSEAASITGLKTPLMSIKNWDMDHYFLDLQGVSIDNSRLLIPEGTFSVKGEFNETGGFMIDTGTTYTSLNKTAFYILRYELARKVNRQRVDDPQKFFRLCYKVYGSV
ncbi:hypothetical protein IFM89_008605 [Coptis chinensis]|uniref:Peptidase A1 domain-containing protein n=1 Tax=Coptis chinensis TaxID=261450 RepID=A0A835LMG3_9MAGN|nr:hypothetical protein IFM89_008605 [Coptis chinensis]